MQSVKSNHEQLCWLVRHPDCLQGSYMSSKEKKKKKQPIIEETSKLYQVSTVAETGIEY